MYEIEPPAELSRLLADYGRRGGVLDFVFLRPRADEHPARAHRAAALEGMAAIARRLDEHAGATASAEFPTELFFRVTWDAARLVATRVPFERFWGSDNATITGGVVPNVDGYKTAFFLPPYTLDGDEQDKQQLFGHINHFVLGSAPSRCDIVAWSTDWSNYFDAGHEWWGAFYWTIRRPGSDDFTVIGASSSD